MEGVSSSLVSKNKEDQQNQEDGSEEQKRIRERLSKMSFGDLLKFKEKIGTKFYNRTIRRTSKDETHELNFKRANKNRPREISSKIRSKQKFESDTIIISKKHFARDPRFEAMCGTFDKQVFKENYKFINDLRKKEKQQLMAQLKMNINQEEKNKVKFLIQRLDNQIREEKIREKNVEKKKDVQNIPKDKKQNFKKKSVERLESLINKFEDLKKANKIKKHIERRSKKLSMRERRKLENQKLF